MEASILQTLSFDINIPIPYRFLRRYAKVCALVTHKGGVVYFPNAGCLFSLSSSGLPCRTHCVLPTCSQALLSLICVCFAPPAVCECRHGHADTGTVLLRDEPDGDGAGATERFTGGLSLPADGTSDQRPRRMGRFTYHTKHAHTCVSPAF